MINDQNSKKIIKNSKVKSPNVTGAEISNQVQGYKKKGYSDEWINQRIKSKKTRKQMTNEWKNKGIKQSKEYAILTNTMRKTWSNMNTKEYKEYKDLNKNESLRDNMTSLELILDSLAHVATTEISKQKNSYGLEENKKIAIEGGTIAYNTRKDIEHKLGRSVVTPENAKSLNAIPINKNKKMIK